MLSQCKLIGLLIICLTLELPTHTHGQFWKNALSDQQNWQRETIATRNSGICYGTKVLDTLNVDLRQRQFSYCCSGYVNLGSPSNLKCEPICEEDCTNGVCLAPGDCECAPGFYREEARCRKYGE